MANKKTSKKTTANKATGIVRMEPITLHVSPDSRKAWHRHVTAEFAQVWAHWQVYVAQMNKLPHETIGVYTSLLGASEAYIAQFGGEPVKGFEDEFRRYMSEWFREGCGPDMYINVYLDWLESYIR